MINKALITLIMLVPFSLSAQPRGMWTRTLVCDSCTPFDWAFADTNSGFIATSIYATALNNVPGFLFTTHDGGQTMVAGEVTNGAFDVFGLPFSYNAHCATPDSFFYTGIAPIGTYHSEDSGATWSELHGIPYRWGFQTPPWFDKSQFSLMLSPQVVVTLGESDTLVVDTSNSSNDFFGCIRSSFYISHDGDSTYAALGDTIEDSVVFGYTSNAKELFAVTSIGGSDWIRFLAHSTDSGNHWAYSYPVDTTSWKGATSFGPIEHGFGSGHYFLLGGRISDTIIGEQTGMDDYLETTDDGVSWNTVSSVASGRVFRVENPGQDTLWAAVGRVPYGRRQSCNIRQYHEPAYHGVALGFVDSIFFSSDGGKSWAKDGKTFAGDTICAMQWLTPRNGYVLTQRDGNTYLYHFIGSPDSIKSNVSSSLITSNNDKILVSPNPSSNIIEVFHSFGTLSILDPLGRSYEVKRSGNTLDVSGLPLGVYYVSDGVSRTKFVKE